MKKPAGMAGLLVGLALAAAASAASADEGPPDAAYRARGLAAYAKQDRVRLTHQRDKGSNMGDDAAEVARMREALAWFRKAVDADPTNAENHAYVGNAHFRLDEFGEAKAAYEAAVALDPAAARYRSNLGSLFAQRGRYAEALHYFQAAKALDPSDGTLAKNYDSAEMFLRFEQMVEELEGRGDGAHWDVAGFVDGRNYSEKVEVTFKFVMEQRADLHERALALLRPAVAARPDFAALSHVLGNTLVAHHQALHPVKVRRGDPAPLLDEARTVVEASLARGAALGAGACPADAAEATGTLRVVSVSSSRRLELDRLAASARRVGATLEVLGLGEPWRGLGSKVDLLRAYLADPDRNIRDGDLLLFLDAYDVLLLPPARDLPAKFAALEIDAPGAVVFNSELKLASSLNEWDDDPAVKVIKDLRRFTSLLLGVFFTAHYAACAFAYAAQGTTRGWSKSGQHKRANFPTSKAHISAVFHSFRLIFGRAIISRSGLEAWMFFPERARAEHSR